MNALPASLVMFTIGEAAQALRVSPRTIRRQIFSGELGAVRIGRGVRVTLSELESYIARRRTA
jgi:excisionase family DNA binding protein